MRNMTRQLVYASAVLISAAAAQAEGMATTPEGMTLYTFDNDTAGISTCYDDCAVKWPPYLAVEGATMTDAGWTMVDRTDGTKQWAYDGKPTYLYVDDKAVGDMLGDGIGGVWHEIAE